MTFVKFDECNDFMQYIICSALGSLPQGEISAIGQGKYLDIKLFINGTECPVKETFGAIEKQIDSLVEEKALKLIDEKLGSLYRRIRRMCYKKFGKKDWEIREE